jgi:amino acid permease
MKNKLFTAVAALTGTVVGAGFLGIPYVVSKSGFAFGLIHVIGIGLMMMIINLMMGEIALSTKTLHQIPGYSSKYLGKKTKMFVFAASIIGFYAALVAYLIGEGESLSFIFTGGLNYSLIMGIIFWIFMAMLTIRGIREFKKIEPLAVLLVFAVVIILGIVNFGKINSINFTYSDTGFFFLPFGVVLFSFLGVSSIPEIKRILAGNERLMKRSIILGSLIPIGVYILFTSIVLGIYGRNVFEVATIGFGKIATLLGMFTMFTAFFALSLALQDTYRFDFKLSFRKSWFLTIVIPFLLFIAVEIFNLAGFAKILSIGGSISGGLLGIAIIFIHSHLQNKMQKKIERKPEYSIKISIIFKILFVLLFIAGIIFEFL